MTDVKLSIRLMCYMHEAFIREAMDGIMMQKVNFPVEVVVGDDFSSDKTLDIIRGYKSTKLIKITILDRQKGDDYWVKRQERGRLYNFQNIIENCKGEYIALLDGDDHWSDPNKLQKQVDYLDKYGDVALVHTNNYTYHEKTGITTKRTYQRALSGSDQENLLKKNFISTPTVMVRTEILKEAIEYINTELKIHKIMDYPLWLYISGKYPIAHLSDFTAVYRLSQNTASRPQQIQAQYDYAENNYKIKKHFCKNAELAQELELKYFRKMLYLAYVNGDKEKAKFIYACISKEYTPTFKDFLKLKLTIFS